MRKRSKRLLKAQERFKAAMTEFILSKGARPGRFYDYALDTSAGLLHVSINDGWIACRFDDVEAGRRFTSECGKSCNPYSGKWNFHFGLDGTVTSLDPAAAKADFGSQIDRLLCWQPSRDVSAVESD